MAIAHLDATEEPAPVAGRVLGGVGTTDAPGISAPGVPGWVAVRRRTILAPCSAVPGKEMINRQDAQRMPMAKAPPSPAMLRSRGHGGAPSEIQEHGKSTLAPERAADP